MEDTADHAVERELKEEAEREMQGMEVEDIQIHQMQ
jgi:hypothetical protein